MGWDFVVLGATGMQGKIVSKDLLENGYSVLMCGRDDSRILHLLKKYKKSKFHYFNADDVNWMSKIITESKAEVVVNCVEGDWNLHVLKACIKAGVNSIDLGSDIPMTREQLKLEHDLKKSKLIHITGCGSVPGIGNVMLRYAAEKFDKIDAIDVGFAWDSNMKVFVVPFSIQSITEEFVTPADMIIHKKKIKIPPMNTLVECIHKAIEKEPQFNVGHHPETFTFYEYTKNKGIKNVRFFAGFPKHSFNTINNIIGLGFAEKEPINFQGNKIIPVNFLTEVLKKLKTPNGYKETENLWVDIYGKKDGKKKNIRMECIVSTLKGWEDAGCNIDTGIPASIMAQMLTKKIIKEAGSYSPEQIVPTKPFFQEIKKRKMAVYENGKRIN